MIEIGWRHQYASYSTKTGQWFSGYLQSLLLSGGANASIDTWGGFTPSVTSQFGQWWLVYGWDRGRCDVAQLTYSGNAPYGVFWSPQTGQPWSYTYNFTTTGIIMGTPDNIGMMSNDVWIWTYKYGFSPTNNDQFWYQHITPACHDPFYSGNNFDGVYAEPTAIIAQGSNGWAGRHYYNFFR